MFQTAWRVSHAERREEREAAGEDDDEEDDTPVVIPSSAVTTYPKGTPVPTPSIKVQVIEERVDLSNNMTGRQMIGVGVRRVVLARGELDKLEGPQYAARRAELRREAGEAARARDRGYAPIKVQRDRKKSAEAHLKISATLLVQTKNSTDLERVAATKLKSIEFFV